MTTQTYEYGSVVPISVTYSMSLADVWLTLRHGSTKTVYKLSAHEIDDDGGGSYSKQVVADEVGPWYYLFSDGNGEHTIEGTFLVDPNQTLVPPVADLRDVRTLIPRVRRALDGPAATSELADATTLSDVEVTALIADAVADILLYTGGSSVFGHMLEVVARDPFYLAPVAWRTDTELSLAEQSVVAAQAAMNYFFNQLKGLQVEQSIQNEGEQWSYRLSVQLIAKQFDLLKEARDNALTEVRAQHIVPEAYISFVAERDAWAARIVEPWIDPGSLNFATSERSSWCPT